MIQIKLIENQVELLMKSLQNYAPEHRDKQQLICVTYESLQEQLTSYQKSKKENLENDLKNNNEKVKKM